MQPLVSVVIPTYNRSTLVCTAIDSVLQQTWTNTEIVLIDDGSTDDTRAVISRYGDRVRYCYQPNTGLPAAARNAGIARATGEYVAFLDSDDYWMPEKLERQMQLFADTPGYGMVACRCLAIDIEGAYLRISRSGSSGMISQQLFMRNFIRTSSAVVSRRCLDAVGWFDERLGEFEEYDLWLRIAVQYPVGFMNDVLAVYVDNPYGISVDSLAGRRWQLMVMQKDYVRRHIDPEIYNRRVADICFLLAKHSRRRARRADARTYLEMARHYHPGSMRTMVYSLASSLHLF